MKGIVVPVIREGHIIIRGSDVEVSGFHINGNEDDLRKIVRDRIQSALDAITKEIQLHDLATADVPPTVN